jgi:hypothetical protein
VLCCAVLCCAEIWACCAVQEVCGGHWHRIQNPRGCLWVRSPCSCPPTQPPSCAPSCAPTCAPTKLHNCPSACMPACQPVQHAGSTQHLSPRAQKAAARCHEGDRAPTLAAGGVQARVPGAASRAGHAVQHRPPDSCTSCWLGSHLTERLAERQIAAVFRLAGCRSSGWPPDRHAWPPDCLGGWLAGRLPGWLAAA